MKTFLKKSILTAIIFNCIFSFNTKAQNVLDGPYIKEHVPKRKFVPYTPLREADVMWSKRIWRTIDLREKINHPLYFPTAKINDRRSLFDVIKDAVLTGQLTAYGNPVLDDEFKEPMTKTAIEKLFCRKDTNYVENVDNGQSEPVVVDVCIESQNIKQYWIKEDWFFDKQRSVLDVRIIGIAPLVEKKNEAGEVTGYSPMFWIYFPEARPIFANAEVYNRSSNSERRTLEDIFWKRQFGSYIRKVDNVYDRNINEYKQGLDALLEAETIKDDIFTFEHDLWHF